MVIAENIRNYEVSIWTLQDSFITVLKQSNLENIEKIQEPKMTLKDDGENTFSFKIPMYIFQNGEFKENPVWYTTHNGNLIANMRKIKVIFNKGTNLEKVFEFIITKVTEEHEGFSKFCNVDCEGLAFHELGKQGYTINLSGEDTQIEYEDWLENKGEESEEPITTIDYWIEKVLDNTDWDYLICMDWSFQDGVLTFENSNGDIDFIDNNRYIYDEKYREDIDTYRMNHNLRSKQKIYRNPYISSWELKNDKLVAKEEMNDLEQLEFKTCVEGSESNRYNLLQSIAEAFQVFCKFVYSYDENYHIIGRTVIFYNNFINESTGILDFNYGYNTQNISREMESTDLISKMYVKSLSDSGVFGGEIFLSDSAANKSLENYLLNFDYLYKIGTISQDQYEEIEDYNKKIRELNEIIQDKTADLNMLQTELPEVQALAKHAEDSLEQDILRLTEADAYINDMIGTSGAVYNNNNPFSFIIIKGDIYYSNVSISGIKGNTLKIYLNKNSNGYVTGSQITKYQLEYDQEGNIIKIKYTDKSVLGNANVVFATFSYDPKIPYKKIQQIYSAKQKKDSSLLEKYNQRETTIVEQIEVLEEEIAEKIDEKQELIAYFERIMGPALREGTWQPERDYATYEINKTYSKNTILTNPINSSDLEVSFIWDEEAFDEEIQNSYTLGIEEEEVYYPCIKLSSDMIGALTKQQLSNIFLVYRDRDTVTYNTANDPRATHYLALNADTGCQYAFLRNKTNTTEPVIPVLMVTGITSLLDYTVNGQTYTPAQQVEFEARISEITGYDDRENIITENVLISSDKIVGSWILPQQLKNYKVVFPRFQINNKLFLQNTPEKRISQGEEFLEENEDYYVLYRNKKWYITLKYETILEKLNAKYSLYYALSTAADAMYLDAIDVLKENAFPKVSYEITPSTIDKNFIKNAYDHLGQLAHINDDELKFENVQGYISEVNLDLDKPWEDSYTIKNYKTKFEDVFSTIVAQTQAMKKNSTVIGMAANLLTPGGIINEDVLVESVSQPATRTFFIENTVSAVKTYATAAVAAKAGDSTSIALFNKIVNGELGLNFGANEKIEKAILNNQEGLIIQGVQSWQNSNTTVTRSAWFQVNHKAMGFFHLNEEGEQVSDLYYDAGNLTLSGIITAKGGEIGGWTIGQTSIYRNSSNDTTYTQLGGDSDYAFFAGNKNASQAPFSVTYKGALKATNAEIKGKITASSGNIGVKSDGTGGWIIGENNIHSNNGPTSLNATTAGLYLGVDGIRGNKNGDTSTFFQLANGQLLATGANISGILTAGSGSQIGGWYIGSNYIGNANSLANSTIGLFYTTTNNTTKVFWSGGKYSDTPNFYVTSNGQLTARGAQLLGATTINTTGPITMTGSSFTAQNADGSSKLQIDSAGLSINPKKIDGDLVSGGLINNEEFSFYLNGLNGFSLYKNGSEHGFEISIDDVSTHSESSTVINMWNNHIRAYSKSLIELDSPYLLLRGSSNNGGLYVFSIRNSAPAELDSSIHDYTGTIWIDRTGRASHSGWTECKIYYMEAAGG